MRLELKVWWDECGQRVCLLVAAPVMTAAPVCAAGIGMVTRLGI